jgi:hypothetical protein
MQDYLGYSQRTFSHCSVRCHDSIFGDIMDGSRSSSSNNSSPPRLEVLASGIGAEQSGTASSTIASRTTTSVPDLGCGSTHTSWLGGCRSHQLSNWLSSRCLDSSRFHGYCSRDHRFFGLWFCQDQFSNQWWLRLLYMMSTRDNRVHTFYQSGLFKPRLCGSFSLWGRRGFSCLHREVLTIGRRGDLRLIPRQVSGFPAS